MSSVIEFPNQSRVGGMRREHRDVLQTMHVGLLDSLQYHDRLDALSNQEPLKVLLGTKIRDRNSNSDPRSRAREMLHELTRRGPNAFEYFIRALHGIGLKDLAYALKIQENAYLREVALPFGHIKDEPDGQTKAVDPQLVTKFPTGGNIYHRLKLGNYYKLFSKPKGYVLFLNNWFFEKSLIGPKLDNRDGTEEDLERLSRALIRIGFAVHEQFPVGHDLSAARMLELVKSFCASPIHAGTDSLVVVIMSHGADNGIIYGSDKDKLTEEAVKKAMTPDQTGANAHITGKPRILIVAACRGNNKDYGIAIATGSATSSSSPPTQRPPEHAGVGPVDDTSAASGAASANGQSGAANAPDPSGDRSDRTKHDGVETDANSVPPRAAPVSLLSLEPPQQKPARPLPLRADKSVPTFADFFIIHSTVKGIVSLRDPQEGTWFIQTLCDVLEDDVATNEEDMGLLVSRVNNKMAKKIGGGGERQIAEYQHSARHGLYLFPRIHFDGDFEIDAS